MPWKTKEFVNPLEFIRCLTPKKVLDYVQIKNTFTIENADIFTYMLTNSY